MWELLISDLKPICCLCWGDKWMKKKKRQSEHFASVYGYTWVVKTAILWTWQNPQNFIQPLWLLSQGFITTIPGLWGTERQWIYESPERYHLWQALQEAYGIISPMLAWEKSRTDGVEWTRGEEGILAEHLLCWNCKRCFKAVKEERGSKSYMPNPYPRPPRPVCLIVWLFCSLSNLCIGKDDWTPHPWPQPFFRQVRHVFSLSHSPYPRIWTRTTSLQPDPVSGSASEVNCLYRA